MFNSDRTSVNVIAEFVNEGILRDTFANFASGSVGSTTSADGGPVSHVPSPTQLSQAVVVGSSGPVVLKSKVTPIQTIKSAKKKLAKKVLHKIRFAKVVTPFHGKAKLQVRVNGKAGMVKLRITVKQGKKSHTLRALRARPTRRSRSRTSSFRRRPRRSPSRCSPSRQSSPTGVRWGGPLRRASPASGP